MDENVLRQIIRQELKALSEGKMLKTREGESVEYASEQHIAELERDLGDLMNMRGRRGLRERERYVLQQAVKHVRASLRKAMRQKAKNDLLTDGES